MELIDTKPGMRVKLTRFQNSRHPEWTGSLGTVKRVLKSGVVVVDAEAYPLGYIECHPGSLDKAEGD